MSLNKCLFVLFVFLSLSALSGCGKNVSLGGKIVYSDDGAPVSCGTIWFTTETFQARAKIGEDGSFVVGSKKLKDGLPPGTYSVYITNAEIPSDKAPKGKTLPPGMQVYVPLIDPKYSVAATSGLSVTVKKSEQIEIKVDRFQY